MCGDDIKRQVGQKTAALGTTFPGKVITTLESEDKKKPEGFSCVSVWGGAEKSGRSISVPSDAPTPELYRVNLFGEVQGFQQHVASCFVRGAQSGLLFSVTGVQVDAWFVYAQALDPRDAIRVSLQASRGCASLSVTVPARFRGIQSDFTDGVSTWSSLPASFTDAPFAPLETETGFYDLITGTGPGLVVVPVYFRVLRATFTGAGVVTMTSAQGGTQAITSPAVIEPRGTLAGPVTFTVPAGVSYQIEVVR